MNHVKQLRNVIVIFFATFLFSFVIQPHTKAADKTYTVTANLFVPGELNTQLPGVTAYLTNGSNPLGVDGYEAVAPTTPMEKNAKLTVYANGKVIVHVPVLNPVFTLQKIGGSSNATIVNAPRNNKLYESSDGNASRKGRITDISVELHDQSGQYVFNDSTEFPTLLGVDWFVPLTLQVDFTGVDFHVEKEAASTSVQQATPAETAQPVVQQEAPAASTKDTSVQSPVETVNADALQAIIQTVEKELQQAVVSKDGTDVLASAVWVTDAQLQTLKVALQQAKELNAKKQQEVDEAVTRLTTTYKEYIASQKSGTLAQKTDYVEGRELAPGVYTISANIWFNKADSGLPLNPHITNSTFPPYNPVANNAQLTIADDGAAKVVIPIVIQDKVMTVRAIEGLELMHVEKLENGAISEITVDLGKLSGAETVVTKTISAAIEMGDLAMSISGLTKEHSWPATFEVNLSGVATKDGGKMPTVELELMNNEAANNIMALTGVEEVNEEPVQAAAPVAEQEQPTKQTNTGLVLAVALCTLVAMILSVWLTKRNKRTHK